MNPSTSRQAATDTRDFDHALEADSLAGFWNARVPKHLPENPFLWKWSAVNKALMRAKDEIGMDFAERRVIKLSNPNLPSKAASRTIQFNFSIVNGHETAAAHRHSIGAIRFVVQGRGAYTTVDGARCDMEPGDLILTPAGSWHDHNNGSTEPVVWLDGLDGPLVQALNLAFFADAPIQAQPIQRVAGEDLRYPWVTARARLAQTPTSDEDPHDGALLRYPELPTLACELSLLRRGRRTGAHRHSSVALYHVVEGAGCTTVGSEALEWGRGDTFVVPAWQTHWHENVASADAVLFSMNDRPALKALGLYREEAT
jgi:gentisate 1,2-dioxygenase